MDVADALVSITLKIAEVSSNSWGGDGIVSTQTYLVTVEDDDAATISVSPISITLVEGKAAGNLLPTGTIFVSLSAQPLEDIIVEIVTEYLNGSITFSKVE